VRIEVARRKVRVNVVPMSFFPRDVIRKMTTYHFVNVLAGGTGNDYPEELERIMGEKPDTNQRLVPKHWLNYGLEQEGGPP